MCYMLTCGIDAYVDVRSEKSTNCAEPQCNLSLSNVNIQNIQLAASHFEPVPTAAFTG